MSSEAVELLKCFGSESEFLDRTRRNTEMFIYDRWIYYFRMITKATLTDLLRSLEEISRSVTDANMKLDHLIETYRYDRNTRPYDLSRDSYHM